MKRYVYAFDDPRARCLLISGLVIDAIAACWAFGWMTSDRALALGIAVSIATLGAVGYQIALATTALELARDELDAVRQDLTISRETQRKADLVLVDSSGIQQRASQWAAGTTIPLAILNKGKTIRDVLLEIYTLELERAALYEITRDESHYLIGGASCKRWFRVIHGPIFEGHLNVIVPEIWAAGAAVPLTLRYRIICEDGTFPPDRFGDVTRSLQ